MKTAEASRALPEIIRNVARQGTRVVVEENGQPIAAIISVQDLERLDRLEAQRRDHLKVVEEIRERNRDKDPAEVERIVAEEIEAMRRERRDSDRPPPRT
jgi:prevent-host-death family protein